MSPTYRGLALGYVIAYVEDVQAAARFYEAIGARKRFFVEGPDGGYVEFGPPVAATGREDGATILAFSASEEARKLFAVETAGESVQVRFIQHTREGVEAVYRAALEAGAESVSEPATVPPWGIVLARFRDPNGLLVSVATPITPRTQVTRLQMIGGPQALEAVLEEGRPNS